MTDEELELRRKLDEPFDPRAVKWLPKVVKGNRALGMPYVDARTVIDRLNDVLGVGGWQDSYSPFPGGSVECRLSIRVNGEWVTRTDVGSPSEQQDQGDQLKAAYSDALKRAAVKFGVGVYLYRLGSDWCEYDLTKKQIVAPPQLPAWALPRPCGPKTAAKIAALIATVCEKTGKDQKLTTDTLLEEYRVPAGKGLESLYAADAAEVLQRLNRKVADLAANPPKPATAPQQPATAGKGT